MSYCDYLIDAECCGIKEFHGLWDFRTANIHRVLLSIGSEVFDYQRRKPPFIMFTETYKKTKIKKLKHIIEDNKLGTMILTPSKINPNSNHSLMIAIWTINRSNFKKWFYKNGGTVEGE